MSQWWEEHNIAAVEKKMTVPQKFKTQYSNSEYTAQRTAPEMTQEVKVLATNSPWNLL